MTLREICETLGVSRRALQGYEKAGLVTASGRNKYGHLLYDKDAEMRIAQIKFYQQLGFSIKEITMIIDAPDTEIKKALEYRVQKLKDEKTEMDELIERANQMIARLSKEAMNKDKGENYYRAYNEDGYYLSLSYEGNNIMLKIHFSSGIAARSCLSVKNDEKIIVNKRMIWGCKNF